MEPVVLMSKEVFMGLTDDRRLPYDRAEVELIRFSGNDILTTSEGLGEEQNECWTPWF